MRRVLGETRVIRPAAERGIDPGDHPGCAAPGLVLRKVLGIEMAFEKGARLREHPRLGPAKAVDRLLGVAHHEQRRPLAGATVGIQPLAQDAPLQRVGVLELVEQQVLVAGIQLHLERGRGLLVGEQAAGLPLGIGKIEAVALGLEVLVEIEQGEAGGEAPAVEPERGLFLEQGLCRQHPLAQAAVQFQELRAGGRRQAPVHLLRGLPGARLALLREQGGLDAVEPRLIGFPQCRLQDGRPLRRLLHPHAVLCEQCLIVAQIGDEDRIGQQGCQDVVILRHPGQRFEFGHGLGQGIGPALGPGPPFGALAHEALQQLAHAGQRQFRDQGAEGLLLGRTRLVAQGFGKTQPGFVQQQDIALDQPARRPRLQRGMGQELEEPAVKGGDLRPGPGIDHGGEQAARLGQQRPRLGFVQAALGEECRHLGLAAQRQQLQPFQQPRPHLTRRLAGEGDRQQFRRLGPGQKQPDHARDQKPGLAAAGAGLDHGVGAGVEGGNQGRRRGGHGVIVIGRD